VEIYNRPRYPNNKASKRVPEPAHTLRDREVTVSGSRRKHKEGKSCAADRWRRMCSLCICPEWDLLHVGQTSWQDFVILLWNNNHFSSFLHNSDFKMKG
jgi:hypothetical protein